MLLSDLDFSYPPELIATEPQRPSRVALTPRNGKPEELTLEQLIDRHFNPQTDLLVINETKVIPARIFTLDEVEILFLKQLGPTQWEVLFPAREFKVGAQLALPGEVIATLSAKGLPQHLTLSRPLAPEYFEKFGEMALPPYIQEARGERHNRGADARMYQTEWARNPGSVAAPTASLHFTNEHLAKIGNIAKITLHVGAGTFLPVRTATLEEHQMHSESIVIPCEVEEQIMSADRVWALGTTAARALESMEQLQRGEDSLTGDTKLFIYPPYEFKNVDVLLTNFHQPRSTLLALVSAFAGEQQVKDTYRWAIERQFKLFSYGDLSVWL